MALGWQIAHSGRHKVRKRFFKEVRDGGRYIREKRLPRSVI